MSKHLRLIAIDVPDTISTSGTVYLDLSGVRREALSRIFGGDTALEGKTTSRDVILSQTKLLKGSACGNLDLCGNNIDASDFFSNGVLNLNTGVDSGQVLALVRHVHVWHTYSIK